MLDCLLYRQLVNDLRLWSIPLIPMLIAFSPGIYKTPETGCEEYLSVTKELKEVVWILREVGPVVRPVED